MKNRLILLLTLTLALSVSLAAKEPVKRTILIKDGKLIEDGRLLALDGELLGFSKTYLGVSLLDLTGELRGYFGAPAGAGVLVSEVADDSPAAKAGLRAGDVILSVDGSETETASDIRRALRDKKGGDAARLEILREKSRQTVVATLAERELRQRFPEAMHLEDLSRTLSEKFNSPEWKARIEQLGDCDGLQSRIRELETRLNQLEKKLK